MSRDRDDPSSPATRYFDATCSQSCSWSRDDAAMDAAMAACNAGDFDVVFCPEK